MERIIAASLPAAGACVKMCEVRARDGIQSWPAWIPTADKIRVLDAIAAAGVTEIDATSFVSARLVPQLKDGEEVLQSISSKIRIRALAVNMAGVERVLAAHRGIRQIQRCGIPFSASEAHNIANLRRNHAEHRIAVAEMIAALQEADIEPLVGAVTAFGCPISGEVAPEQVMSIIDWAAGLGVRAIMLGDTTGVAHPGAVAALFSAVASSHPGIDLIAHFHDNRGAGILNTLTAIGAGATTFDSCLGGMGGEPKGVEQGVVGDQGNVITEDIIAVLSRMGIATGIDPEAIIAAGRLAEAVIGRPLFSKVQRAGLVMHG